MIQFELSISNPRLTGAIFRGGLRLTTDGKSYEVPFDEEFEGDLIRFHQAIDTLARQNTAFDGVFRDESSSEKTYHIWSLIGDQDGNINLKIYRFVKGSSQKDLVFEYNAPWLSFILDFSKISETNAAGGLWDILTAWNTLRKRAHKKPISITRVFYSAQQVIYDLFCTVTYPVNICDLYNTFCINRWGQSLLKVLQCRFTTVQQTIEPTVKNLRIVWKFKGVPFYSAKINWSYFDQVYLKGDNILVLRNKTPVLVIPKAIFSQSEYVDFAQDYAYYFGIYLYDSWFHGTQFWD